MKLQINKTTIQIILLILVCCIFYIIFSFSNQKGIESEGLSRKISTGIIDIANLDKDLNQSQKQQLIINVDRVVRKTAHFTLYTIVGIILMLYLSTTEIRLKNKIIITLIIGIIYATSDEIHQKFVADRTSSITDIFIDTAGVLFGVFIISILTCKKRKALLNRTKNNQKI